MGDLNKSIETLQVATQEYPLDASNFINLGVFYLTNGQLEKSDAANRRALALQPDNAIALENGVAGAPTWVTQPKVEKYIATAQRLGLNGTSLLGVELSTTPVLSDWNNVQKIIAETAGRPDQFVVTGQLGSMLPQLGQIQLAKTTLLRAADQAASANEKDAQAASLLNAASAGWMVDRCFDPEAAAKQALKLDKGKVTLIHSRQHPGSLQ